jgi:deoxyribodipyrimidine photo-lyase
VVSPRRVWHAVRAAAGGRPAAQVVGGAEVFLRELGWREFASHLLFHFPHTATAPLRADYARFPWVDDPVGLQAWQRGRTGYPIVDAGMRQLWATGWMHNRVRMIVASFLVKDLRVSWLEGARWFWDTLVDADLAANTLGWQWAAGCGADAAPYFRIFNPTSQGNRFDPAGDYVRAWVPELSRLAAADIHEPDAGPRRHRAGPWIPRADRGPRRGAEAGAGGAQDDVGRPLDRIDRGASSAGPKAARQPAFFATSAIVVRTFSTMIF